MSPGGGEWGVSELSRLAEAAASDPAHLRSIYRVVGREAVAPILALRWERALAGGSRIHEVDGAAVLIGRDEPVERWYGRRAMCAEFLVLPRPERGRAAAGALESLCSAGIREGVEMVSLRIEASDTEALAAANRTGFHVVDVIGNQLIRPVGARSEPMPIGDLVVEQVVGERLVGLSDPWMPEFRARSGAFPLSRYRADPYLGGEQSSRIYEEWVERAFAGEWADEALVAWAGDEPAAVLFYRLDREVADVTGLRWCGRGLAVTRSAGLGVYGDFIAATHAGVGQSDAAQFDVHVANRPAMQALWSSGVVRQGTVTLTLHRWLA